MHVADITMFWAPGSGGVRTYLQAKHDWLKNYSNVEHTLLVPGAQSQWQNGICTLRTALLPFGHGYRFPLREQEWLARIREVQPDLIEVSDPYRLAWTALRIGQEMQIPVVGFYHSDLIRLVNSRLGHWTDRILDRYIATLYSRFDQVFAPSRVMADKLRRLGVERVTVQPLGVDTDLFHPQNRDRAVRTQLGLEEHTYLLIFAGRASREKNIPLLLQAMQRLGPQFHLHLVGSRMPDHLPGNVSCTRNFLPQRQLARLLASSDALVHAGDRETFGLVVLEAMASGLPVIGVTAGAVPELVVPGTGLLARPNCSDAMTSQIKALFAGDYRTMGRLARQVVVANYGWMNIFPALLEHYRGLVYGTPTWSRAVNL